MANISIRKYTYHLPHPLPPSTPIPYTPNLPSTNPLNLPAHPSEPTSSLVLTTPGNAFVDIRILKPLFPGDAALPNETDVRRGGRSNNGSSNTSPTYASSEDTGGGGCRGNEEFGVVNGERLEWAVAGYSRTTPLLPSEGQEMDSSESDSQSPSSEQGPNSNGDQNHEPKPTTKPPPEEQEEEEEGGGGGEDPIHHKTRYIYLSSKPIHLPFTYSIPEIIPTQESNIYPLTSTQTDPQGKTIQTHYKIELGVLSSHSYSVSPTTGRSTEVVKGIGYEELWQDIPILCTPSSTTSTVPQDSVKNKVVRSKFAATMRTQDPARGIRGMVVRVGQFVQGAIVVMAIPGEREGECVVERWEYVVPDHQEKEKEKEDEANGDGDKEGVQGYGKGEGMWMRRVKIGERSLPCAVLFREEELRLGTTVCVSGLTWVVEEVSEWGELE